MRSTTFIFGLLLASTSVAGVVVPAKQNTCNHKACLVAVEEFSFRPGFFCVAFAEEPMCVAHSSCPFCSKTAVELITGCIVHTHGAQYGPAPPGGQSSKKKLPCPNSSTL